jgi:hypothetical protein
VALIDNFDRANAANLGADWTADIYGISALSPEIVSNAAKGTGVAQQNAYYSAGTFGSDFHAGIEIVVHSGAYPFSIYMITSGVGTSGEDGYQLAYTGGDGSLELYREDNGVDSSVLGAWAQTIAANNWVWLSTSGTAVRAHHGTTNDFGASTLIGSVTDNTYRSATTYVGLQLLPDTVVNNFYGATVTPVGGLTPPYVAISVA